MAANPPPQTPEPEAEPSCQSVAAEPQQCNICTWRRRCIQQEPDATDAPPWACDSAVPSILQGFHAYPGDVWYDIIATETLCSPTFVERTSGWWARLPLRCPGSLQAAETHYSYSGLWHEPRSCVVGFHNTRLESLVRTTTMWGFMVGNGILNDRRLAYGHSTHDGNSGVNIYSDGGLETFAGSKNWVQIEVECNSTKTLRGGRPNRYCIRGPGGDICMKAYLRALWVPLDELPCIVALS